MGASRKIAGTWVVVVAVAVLSRWVGVAEASHAVYEHLQSLESSNYDPKLRTGYHFQPPKHWINGPMYYNGVYHLFYQYNPKGAVWGNIVWAHSVSTDLINWLAVEPAIHPTEPFDINGCWSGSATILPGNRPVILYTGVDTLSRQVQNIAFPKNLSDPYLRKWVKPKYNPLIQPVGGINASSFRDPTTAWSRDFKRWVKAKHALHTAGGTGMWECPDFYPVSIDGKQGLDTSEYGEGVKHVFKVSLDLTRYEYYTVGTYDQEKDQYVPDGASPDGNTGLRYDYGNFYASKTFYDAAGKRRILWGWANESDSVTDDNSKGWAGIQVIPRAVWLDKEGKQLVQWPVEEIETLRGKQIQIKHKIVKSGKFFEVKGIQTAQADVEVIFDVKSLEKAEPFDPSWSTNPQGLCGIKGGEVKGGVGPFGLFVLASSKLEERTAVFFRVFRSDDKHVVLMCNDPTRSSYKSNLYKPTFAGFVDVDIAKNSKISLRTLIDHSVVESFGENGKTCITSRVYPSLAVGSNVHLFVFNNGAEDIEMSQLKGWEMKNPRMNDGEI
ncbi:Beta-fructofuranosidase, insoluble isoenzyme 3 [Ananas comosus]|uniref:Beta-fructofuranosidase, insoluble isoenzyme 3 n=1 Tax=Ananas comosus TaxID=4615 RepID=A0A199UTK0_ANACO|nr:Beta-fructofuranosidase, insoluble isoenzyme 3 [Ananas comosus]